VSNFLKTYASKSNQPVIDLFLKKAEGKEEEIIGVAERLHQSGKHFERALADALETFNRV